MERFYTMSTKEGNGVTPEEIQRVKSMIKQCLRHYMRRKEAMDIIYKYQKIDPSLTNTVWKRAEEQNPEHFKAYYQRLILCRLIKRFNHLLKKQAAVMDQMKHGDEVAMSNVTHMQQMHPIPTFNAGPSKHSGMQYTYNTSAFENSSSMWLDQNPNQVAFAPESHIPLMRQVQHPVPRVLLQTIFNNSGPSAHSERPHAYPSNTLLAQIPENGIPPVSDYPYNTLLVQNMDGGMIQGMHNWMNPIGTNQTYLVPTNLPEPGCAICGRSPMEHSYGYPFNTSLAQIPTVGIIQGMNNGMISVNNNTTSLVNYGNQIGNSGVQLQAPLHQLSIPSPPPVKNEPCSPGDQHSSNN